MASGKRPLLELEAAETLSALGGRPLDPGRWIRPQAPVDLVSPTHSQDQVAVGVDSNPSSSSCRQICNKSYENAINPAAPVINKRRKLTEAEKEEKNAHRMSANRESARQTIRNRQAVHEEMTNKVAHLLQENERLNKENDLALNQYKSLERTYEFLKAQFDKLVNKAPAAEEGPSNTSTDPHNQPCNIFWLPIQQLPPSFHSSLSQFQMPCLPHQGQQQLMGNTMPGAPLLAFPALPYLLAFLPPAPPNACTCKCSCSDSPPPPHDDNIHPPGHIIVPGLFSPVRPLDQDRAQASSQRNQDSLLLPCYQSDRTP